MSEQGKQKAEPKIIRVSFRDPVEIGVGDFASIQAWTEQKHGKHIECAEKGNWIVMTVRGHRFRVPMTNVAYVVESVS